MTSIALAPKTLKFEGGPSKRVFPQEAREKGLLHDDGTRQDRTQPRRYPAHGRLCPDQGSQAPGIGRGQEEPPGGGRSLAMFHFESYETMWLQIHEMLYIEKGGEAQIPDELRAYNPLIPKGDELVAMLMFEIDDPVRRSTLLNKLGGVENTITLQFAGETVTATPERDVERTSEEGKASSVHFIHFTLTAEQIAKFRAEETRVILGIGHDQYGHMAVLPEAVRSELAR